VNKLAVVICALTLVSGCSSGSKGSSGDPVKAASLSSSVSADDCSSIVGQPVGSASGSKLAGWKSCGGFVEPGSGGCYKNGQQAGSFFYISTDSKTIFGVPGGSWQSGTKDMSISAIASALGC